MATNRNIVDMVEAIRKGRGNSESGGVDGIYLAAITSIEPLTIQMYGKSISKKIYINPALTLEASDTGEKIGEIFREPSEIPETYRFLKEFHERYALKKRDTVIVCMVGSSFYIAGKAVRV